MKTGFWFWCNRYPPPLVRLLARQSGAAMTTEEIASRCGWIVTEVEQIANTPTWDSVSLTKIRTFTRACNLDFTDRDQLNVAQSYLREQDAHPKWSYLLNSPLWKPVFMPLIVRWRKAMGKPDDNLPPAVRRLLKGFKA